MPPKTNEERIEEFKKTVWHSRLKALFYNEIPDLTADITKLLQLNLAVDILLTEKDKEREEAVEEARRKVYDNLYNNLLRTEAILARKKIDGDDEFSEEYWYNRGYFEAVDDIAKHVATYKDAITPPPTH